jgi:hypothetical protein
MKNNLSLINSESIFLLIFAIKFNREHQGLAEVKDNIVLTAHQTDEDDPETDIEIDLQYM